MTKIGKALWFAEGLRQAAKAAEVSGRAMVAQQLRRRANAKQHEAERQAAAALEKLSQRWQSQRSWAASNR